MRWTHETRCQRGFGEDNGTAGPHVDADLGGSKLIRVHLASSLVIVFVASSDSQETI